jgi:hypothetical protein
MFHVVNTGGKFSHATILPLKFATSVINSVRSLESSTANILFCMHKIQRVLHVLQYKVIDGKVLCWGTTSFSHQTGSDDDFWPVIH